VYQQFLFHLLFEGAWAYLMCLVVTSMLIWQSTLLWWIIDSVSLPLVIKAKVVKEAFPMEICAARQEQSYVNQTELTSEFNLQCNYSKSLSLNDTFVRRTTDLEKTANMIWLSFSLSLTTSADTFLYGNAGARTVARKFLIGGLCVSARGFGFVRGGLTL